MNGKISLNKNIKIITKIICGVRVYNIYVNRTPNIRLGVHVIIIFEEKKNNLLSGYPFIIRFIRYHIFRTSTIGDLTTNSAHIKHSDHWAL